MRVAAHGLVIDSDVDLHLDRPSLEPADVLVRLRPEAPVADGLPDGEVLARLHAGSHLRFALVRDGRGLLLHFPRLASARIDTSLTEVDLHLDPRTDPGMAAVLLNGYVATALLTARGHLVLHATAYAVDGRAVAMVGASGMGKSTSGVLACRAGARLVSDDVLRVAPSPDGGGWVCWPGTTESRLRPAAAGLALPGEDARSGWQARSRSTADGRTALIPGGHAGAARDDGDTGAPLPLVEVLVPTPDRQTAGPRFEPLTGAAALLELSRYPRLVGLEHPGWVRAGFEGLSALVRSVPVARAVLPWGPPWPPESGRALVERAAVVGPAGTVEPAGTVDLRDAVAATR